MTEKRRQTRVSDGISEKNQILLTFANEEEVDYILTVARRKGYHLPNYILDNMNWDQRLPCLSLEPEEKITKDTCHGCEFSSTCPDVVK
jgi:hypothetical protein